MNIEGNCGVVNIHEHDVTTYGYVVSLEQFPERTQREATASEKYRADLDPLCGAFQST